MSDGVRVPESTEVECLQGLIGRSTPHARKHWCYVDHCWTHRTQCAAWTVTQWTIQIRRFVRFP